MMRKLTMLFVVFVVVLSLAATVSAHRGERHYEVTLASLNGSGVSGTAYLTLDDDDLTVSIRASGFEADMLHPQHIHGFEANKRNSTCPTDAADVNDDGVVDLGEGLPSYGPVLLSLEPFPTAPDGTIEFEETYSVDGMEIGPLQNRAIVLHGMTVDGEYVPTLPIACGQIQAGG